MSSLPVRTARLPLWFKLLYTAFLVVLVPVYWVNYGPTNFLFFCDVALFLALAAVWTESPLLASMPTVGILLPQALWQVDFLAALFGLKITGMTGYMFEAQRSLFLRGLSFFHFWLPIMLVWLVWRLGYDRRGLVAWTLLAWALMLVCYFFLPGPSPAEGRDPNVPVNINYVFGFSEEQAQQWARPRLYLALLMLAMPLLLFLPAHLILCWLFPPPQQQARRGRE